MSKIPKKMIAGDVWDDEIFKVVGEITIAFAQLDHVMCFLPKRIKRKSVRDLSKQDWKDIKKNKFIPNRCKQIRREAGDCLDEAKRATLEPLLAKALDLNDQRNSVAHGQWGYKKAKPRGDILSRHRIWKGEDRRVIFDELKGLRDNIRSLRDDLQSVIPPLSYVPENISQS